MLKILFALVQFSIPMETAAGNQDKAEIGRTEVEELRKITKKLFLEQTNQTWASDLEWQGYQ